MKLKVLTIDRRITIFQHLYQKKNIMLILNDRPKHVGISNFKKRYFYNDKLWKVVEK